MTSSEKQQHSIAFLGTHNWRGDPHRLERAGLRGWPLEGAERLGPCCSLPAPSLSLCAPSHESTAAHESVRWWHAAQSAGKRAAAEAAAPVRRTDVFGVARPDMPEDAAKHLSQLQWLALKPGSDERVAAARRVEAVVCSGQGPNDVQARTAGRRQLAVHSRPPANPNPRRRHASWQHPTCMPHAYLTSLHCVRSLPLRQVAKDSRRAGKAVFVESLVSRASAPTG